jgi:transcriptional regulator with XRE-family HTH domain
MRPVDSLEEWLTQPEGAATALRALRVRAGLSGKQLADPNGWAQSKVSRIENGQQMASADDVAAWGRTTGASAAEVQELLGKITEARVWNTTFKGRMHRGQAAVQEDYARLAATSTLIRHFETVFVPGPLQIPDYARRVLTEMIALHDVPCNDIDASIEQRQRRAQMLYDPAKRWEFILAEPVLRWLLPTPAVMRAQLHRLLMVPGMEHVRFGIIPLGIHLATTPQNTFEVYAGEEVVAIAETFIGETVHRDEQAASYNRAMDLLWEEAVEGDGARDLILRAAQALPEG